MKKILIVFVVLVLSVSAKAQEQNSESMKKVVVARLDIKPDAVDQFIQSAQKIVNETRKEKGCVTYMLYKSSFSPENEFIFYEEYTDQDALDYHNGSEHLSEFFAKITPMLDGAPIVETY